MAREKEHWVAYAKSYGGSSGLKSVVIDTDLRHATHGPRKIKVVFTEEDARHAVELMLDFLGIDPRSVEGLYP